MPAMDTTPEPFPPAPPTRASVGFRPAHSRQHDPRPLVAVDWSAHSIHITFDGDAVAPLPHMDALLELLDQPHQIVVESTLESFDPHRRRRILDAARTAGHEIYGYRPRHTARARPDGWAKTDANDARIIHALATEQRLPMFPLGDPAPEWVTFRDAVCDQYLRLRLAGRKEDLAAAAADILGPYPTLEPEMGAALGNGRTYSTSALAVLYVAAWHTRSREQFERLLGLHASGYPTVLRSDLHTHHVRHRFNSGRTWQQLRPQLRRARRCLADAFADGCGIDPGRLLGGTPDMVTADPGAAATLTWDRLEEDGEGTGAALPDDDQLAALLAARGPATTAALAAAAGLAARRAPALQLQLQQLARAGRAARTGSRPHQQWYATPAETEASSTAA